MSSSPDVIHYDVGIPRDLFKLLTLTAGARGMSIPEYFRACIVSDLRLPNGLAVIESVTIERRE